MICLADKAAFQARPGGKTTIKLWLALQAHVGPTHNMPHDKSRLRALISPIIWYT
jgi:hypothetical protein